MRWEALVSASRVVKGCPRSLWTPRQILFSSCRARCRCRIRFVLSANRARLKAGRKAPALSRRVDPHRKDSLQLAWPLRCLCVRWTLRLDRPSCPRGRCNAPVCCQTPTRLLRALAVASSAFRPAWNLARFPVDTNESARQGGDESAGRGAGPQRTISAPCACVSTRHTTASNHLDFWGH